MSEDRANLFLLVQRQSSQQVDEQISAQQNEEIVRRLHLVQGRVADKFDTTLKPNWGLTRSEAHILIALLAGPSNGTGLSRMLGIDNGGVSRLLFELADRKLIERTRAPVDRRQVFAQLTTSGIEVALQLKSGWREAIHHVFDVLTPSQREQLLWLTGVVTSDRESI